MQTRQLRSKIRERTNLVLRPRPGNTRQGFLVLGRRVMPCALGRSGLLARKREGDGGTPLGTWRLMEVRYRPDRVARPVTGLPVRALRPDDGWCDAAGDRNYNRAITLPYPASAEAMWRDDHLYDIVVVLDHNTRPRARGLGSAVFMHLAREGYQPTQGCVALSRHDMEFLLSQCGTGSALAVQFVP